MKIIGTGSALPHRVVTNGDMESFLDTTDGWIVSRTGIRSRHVISDERLEDLGRDAALRALEDAGRRPEDIDLLLCSNVVNEYMTPGLGWPEMPVHRHQLRLSGLYLRPGHRRFLFHGGEGEECARGLRRRAHPDDLLAGPEHLCIVR